jgi:hypothetical protein
MDCPDHWNVGLRRTDFKSLQRNGLFITPEKEVEALCQPHPRPSLRGSQLGRKFCFRLLSLHGTNVNVTNSLNLNLNLVWQIKSPLNYVGDRLEGGETAVIVFIQLQ